MKISKPNFIYSTVSLAMELMIGLPGIWRLLRVYCATMLAFSIYHRYRFCFMIIELFHFCNYCVEIE